VTSKSGSKSKNSAEKRAIHVDVKAKAVILVVDTEAAIAGKQRERVANLIAEPAHGIPEEFGRYAEAADHSPSSKVEIRAEIDPALEADNGIDPCFAGVGGTIEDGAVEIEVTFYPPQSATGENVQTSTFPFEHP